MCALVLEFSRVLFRSLLELVGEFAVEHLREQVLEAAVIGLQDRVLGGKIDRPAAIEAVVEAGAGEVPDRIVQIVHAHGDAGAGEIEDFLFDLLAVRAFRSEEHTSELQSLMRISSAVFFLKNKNKIQNTR